MKSLTDAEMKNVIVGVQIGSEGTCPVGSVCYDGYIRETMLGASQVMGILNAIAAAQLAHKTVAEILHQNLCLFY